jgi:hypothetical protein
LLNCEQNKPSCVSKNCFGKTVTAPPPSQHQLAVRVLEVVEQSRIETLYKIAECFTLYKAQREVARGYYIDIEDLQSIRVNSTRSTQIIIVNDLEEASFLRISSKALPLQEGTELAL